MAKKHMMDEEVVSKNMEKRMTKNASKPGVIQGDKATLMDKKKKPMSPNKKMAPKARAIKK